MLREHWRVADARVEYAPVGHCSHHWMADLRGASPPRGSGHAPDPQMLRLYAGHWELSELARAFNHFRQPHGDDADDRVWWQILTDCLPVEPRWPEL